MSCNCLLCNNIFKSQRSVLSHVKNAHKYTTQQYYDFVYPNSGKCIMCNKSTSFVNFKYGYKQYCSAKCAAQSDLTKQKRHQTNLEKYGYEYISQVPKIKEQKVIKYKEHLQEIQEKVKQTNRQKYGCDWVTQSDLFKEKSKQTMIDKYNVDNYAKSNEWLNKFYKKSKENEQIYKEFGYIPIKDVFVEYGTGWYQAKIIDVVIYKHKAYIKNDDLIKIEQYNSEHKYTTRSKLEDEFYNYIKTFYNNTITLNSKQIIKPYELDIYLPDIKIGIEINGIYRHSQLCNTLKEYHLIKSLLCREQNIRLIHIYEFEDMTIQKQLLKDLILGIDNYSKNDFNKNNLIKEIPQSEIIYNDNRHIIYGAGKLY